LKRCSNQPEFALHRLDTLRFEALHAASGTGQTKDRPNGSFYLQLASAAKARKHSTAVAEKISGKYSTSMKAPFQVILFESHYAQEQEA